MANFTGSMSMTVIGSLTGTVDFGSVGHNQNKSYKTSFANGTGASQANQIFSDQRSIAGSSNEDIDLAGALVDALGSTVTFTSIKGIMISSASANGNDIQLGAAATNQFFAFLGSNTDLVNIVPGGLFCITNPEADGYAVTAGTGDLLRITNTDSSTITYDIHIIGEV